MKKEKFRLSVLLISLFALSLFPTISSHVQSLDWGQNIESRSATYPKDFTMDEKSFKEYTETTKKLPHTFEGVRKMFKETQTTLLNQNPLFSPY